MSVAALLRRLWLCAFTMAACAPLDETEEPQGVATAAVGTDLALGKPATASSMQSTFEAAKAFDGNTTTRWSSAFSDPQWISVDLGASYNITGVKLTWEAAYATGYQIQVSSNASTWTTIYSTSTGNGGVDDLAGLAGTGRYVRMSGTKRGTQWGYSLWGFEVYGSPASASSNLARNRPISASSVQPGYEPAKAVDGNTASRWASSASDPQWISVDLGASYTINRVKLTWETAFGKSYQIQVSPNGSTWTTVYSTTTGDGGVDDLSGLSATGRYVRMLGSARGTQWGYSLWELEVYGAGGTCIPTTCAAQSKTCGTIPDGCGGTLTCGGSCTPGGPAEPPPLTFTQLRLDNGTLATRPFDPSRNIRHGDNGVYPVLNFGFSWYFGGDQYLGDPTRIPSTRWGAMTAWHIIYPEAQYPGGPAKPTVANKNIILRRYQSWVHLKAGGWVKMQSAPPDRVTTWQTDAEQSNSLPGNPNTRIINDPRTGEPLFYENAPAPAYMNHGWISARGTFANGSVDGAYSTFDVRCDQPGANLLAASGIDWWESSSAPWPNNTGYSQSSWIRVTTDWTTVTGTSLSEAILRADPPPPVVGIGE